MKKKLHYFIFIFILNGCVEHFFYIDIKPEGDLSLKYKKEYVLKNKLDLNRNILPDNKYILSVLEFNNNYEKLLNEPIYIKKKNYFFFETTNLEIVFKKRDITNQFPILLNLINKKNTSENGISNEIIEFIFNQTIEDCEFGFNIYPIVKSDIENWYKSLNNESDSIIFKNYETYKNEGKKIINNHLINSNLNTNLDSILNLYESESALTLNFINDKFNFEINWNDKIFYHNADSFINNRFYWNFSIYDFSEKDLQINIKAIKIDYIKSLFFSFIIIFILIYKKNIFFR